MNNNISGNNPLLPLIKGPAFDPNSREYSALKYAAKGALDNLRKYFPLELSKVNTLVQVTSDEAYYTPLHYALNHKEWQVVAYLLNQGCDFNLKSRRKDVLGKSPLEMIATTPNGLKNILEALIQLEEPIHLDTLFLLISSSDLLVERRREVICDAILCKGLGQKLRKEEALLIMASLMIGSFSWKNLQTDINTLVKQPLLKANATLNCSQMLAYASLLSGETTFEKLLIIMNKGMNIDPEVHRRIISPETSKEEQHSLMLLIHKTYGKNFGLLMDPEHLLDIKNPPLGNIHVFYIVQADGFIDHYGLFFRSSKGDVAIHIEGRTKQVSLEPAQFVFQHADYKTMNVYWSMLPWVSSKI